MVQAADALLIEGHRPTIDRIRMRLGRGSPNTIQEHLDRWWTKLGTRLKDIPGQEIPGIPNDVATALVGLWNTAVDNAYTSLGESAAAREADLMAREAALVQRETTIDERERASATPESSVDEALMLARDQLASVNQRAERLEATASAKDEELNRLRASAEAAANETRDLRAKLDAVISEHRSERQTQDERFAATESRWMLEVDRARQALKDVAKEHEKQGKDVKKQSIQMQAQRDEARREVQALRAEIKALQRANSVLEKLRALPPGSAGKPGIRASARSKTVPKRAKSTTRKTQGRR